MNVRNLTIGILVATALAAIGCGGSDGISTGSKAPSSSSASAADTAQPKADAQTQAAADAAKRFDAAEKAVQDGNFAQALATASKNGASDTSRIRRKISRTLAAEASALVDRGNLAAARARIDEAGRYGSTPQISDARSAYKRAQRRAAEREAKRQAAARRAAVKDKAAKLLLERATQAAEAAQSGGPSAFDAG